MNITETNVQVLPLKDLHENKGQIEGVPANPRILRDDKYKALLRSLQEDDLTGVQPLKVYNHNGQFVVLGGNMRLKALRELKRDASVSCLVVPQDTPTDILRKIVIIDNSTFGEWDFDMLANEWDADELNDWGVSVPEIETQDDEPTAQEDDFDEERDTVSVICQKGDVWQLGAHRLMCGDSTSADDVAVLMDGNIVDLAFTSPPYNAGSSEELSGNTHTQGSKYIHSDDNLAEYKDLLFSSTKNSIEVSKYSFVNLQMLAGNKADICDYFSVFKNNLCDIGIWNKTTTAPAMARRVMNSQFEFVFMFSKDKPSRAVGTRDFRGNVSNVFTCPPVRNNEFSSIHAATFSVDFVSYFLTTFSNDGESVLDLFGGTGTTLIACEQLNRKCYMMEIDTHYCDVIIARWEKLTGQKATKIK